MSEQRADGLLPTMSGFVEQLVADYDLTEVLQVLVERSAELFGADSAALQLAGASSQLQVMASAGVVDVGSLWQQVDQGPCFDSYRTGELVRVTNIADAGDRWPQWQPVAHAAGFRDVAAVPVGARGTTFGSLSLLSRGTLELDGDAGHAYRILAHVTSLVLVHERSRQRDETLIQQLETALSVRVVIEQAKGVLSERLGISLDDAFALLREDAKQQGLRVSGLADDVVAGRRQLQR